MMFLVIMLLVACFLLGIFIYSNIDELQNESMSCMIMMFALSFISGMLITKISPYPSAIDVYRGNTTLKITYQDSIPVDTIVVFKGK